MCLGSGSDLALEDCSQQESRSSSSGCLSIWESLVETLLSLEKLGFHGVCRV